MAMVVAAVFVVSGTPAHADDGDLGWDVGRSYTVEPGAKMEGRFTLECNPVISLINPRDTTGCSFSQDTHMALYAANGAFFRTENDTDYSDDSSATKIAVLKAKVTDPESSSGETVGQCDVESDTAIVCHMTTSGTLTDDEHLVIQDRITGVPAQQSCVVSFWQTWWNPKGEIQRYGTDPGTNDGRNDLDGLNDYNIWLNEGRCEDPSMDPSTPPE
ncbi:hypothetical protein [Streptomyces syringium]|uniref:hypothetical protein n=1 Tax=Streptomyces syringium TaxID=76729 RepID=UPI0033C2FC0B